MKKFKDVLGGVVDYMDEHSNAICTTICTAVFTAAMYIVTKHTNEGTDIRTDAYVNACERISKLKNL